MDSGDALAPGTMIDDEYRIDGLLGRGGMGVVYRARDMRLDRPVAVKLHRGKGMAHERLAREATALARLSHPNVVNVYRVGTHAGRVYVAMELVEGGTLRHRDETPQPWRDVLRLHTAAGDGLAAAHAAGLVHRDYKPDNVLLGADGRPRVADFGLARATGDSGSGAVDPGALATAETVEISDAPPSRTAAPDGGATTDMLSPGAYLANVPDTPRTPRLEDRITVTGAWVGTPAYMAPEQIDGRLVDARSDQFAFAVSLWEALHGVRPFAGETTFVLRAAIARQQLAGADRGEVPRWIDDILRRALREEPDERWPSMDAILTALRHDPARRRRQIGLGVGAVALAGGAAMIAWQAKSGAPARARCDTGPTEIAETWGGQQAAALRGVFAGTGLPYATALADKVIAQLDSYSARWATHHQTACTTTAERRWSAALGDRAVACLARRRRELAEAVSVLSSIEGERIDDALSVVGGLSPPDACSDPEQLGGQERLGPEADELISLIARGNAMNDVYDPRAKEVADRAVAAGRSLGNARLAAEADTVRAEAAFTSGDGDAIKRYEEAFFASRRAGDEHAANAIALRLVILIVQNGELDEARTWLRHAEAGSGLHPTPNEVAFLGMARAMVTASDGHYDDALSHLQDARRRLEALPDGERYLPDVLDLEGGIFGQKGDLLRSIELGRASLATVESAFGPEHPVIVSRLSNLGLSLSDAGKHEEAVAMLRRAVAVCRPAPACQDELGINLLNLGAVETNARKLDDALRDLDEADRLLVALGEAGVSERALVASARGNALEAQGKMPEAEASLRHALELTETSRGKDHPEVARVLNNLGSMLNGDRRFAEAAPLFERAIAIWATVAKDAPEAGLPMLGLGRAQLGVGQPRLAIATLRESITRLDAGGLADLAPVARMRLAQALWAAGDRDEARTVTRALPTSGIPEDIIDEIKAWQATVDK